MTPHTHTGGTPAVSRAAASPAPTSADRARQFPAAAYACAHRALGTSSRERGQRAAVEAPGTSLSQLAGASVPALFHAER